MKARPVTTSTEKPRITCYSNIIRDLDSLESTQLFSAERFKEIKDYVSEDKFGPVELKNGKYVPDWICHYDTGLMWGKWIAENGRGFLPPDEMERIARYLEMKAMSIDFKKAVARTLTEAGLVFEQDVISGSVVADFVVEKPVRTAIECKFNVNRDWERTIGTAKLLREQLPCERVVVVVPYRSGLLVSDESDWQITVALDQLSATFGPLNPSNNY